MRYWLSNGDSKTYGPYEIAELNRFAAEGRMNQSTQLCAEGGSPWVSASSLIQIRDVAPPTPPSYSGLTTYSPSAATYEPQSFKKLWLWLAWLVGAGLPLCFIIIGIVPLIAGYVIGCILLYRYWYVIQDGKARTSPGKAVGFSFIPFFNLYWMFVAFVGLAKDMNAYCDERNISGPRVSEGMALAFCILGLFGIIPYVGIVTSIAGTVIGIILYKQLADTAARIMEMKTR